MVKPTPNPPESEAELTTHRASSLHLKPAILKGNAPQNPSTMFILAPNIDTETLLAHACESLASDSISINRSGHTVSPLGSIIAKLRSATRALAHFFFP